MISQVSTAFSSLKLNNNKQENKNVVVNSLGGFVSSKGRVEFVCIGVDLGNKNIVLIAGGADKGIGLTALIQSIKQHCKHVILTPGNGTDMLVVAGSGLPVLVETLEQAIKEAKSEAENGDIILFSPAFASFAQYKNEYERNDEFVRLVADLVEHAG